MTLILNNEEIRNLLTMGEYLEVLEDAYIELAEGRAVSRTSSECVTPTSRPDALYALKSMDGVVPKLGVSCIRILSDIITWPKQGDVMRVVKVPAAPNERYVGLVLLFSTETGEPLAIFPDGEVQRMRVGAASALAAKYLAREDARRVAILGSGFQAAAQLAGICAVRKISSIRCFSPSRENREAFAKEMTAKLDVDVKASESPEQAVEGADVVACASNCLDAIFFEKWVRPGMHLSSIKTPEIEIKAVKRAGRIVVHTKDVTSTFVHTKGVVSPKASKGRVGEVSDKFDFDSLPTLSDLLSGRSKGRQSDQEITCFLNNMGLGFQFAATGAVVYRKAKAMRVGNELPTDWFTEKEHP